MCDGRHDARAAYLEDDVFEYRRHLLGGKFEGDGEARSLARVAEHVLIPLFIYLYDDAVRPIVFFALLSRRSPTLRRRGRDPDPLASGFPSFPIADTSLNIFRMYVMRVYIETELPHIIQFFCLSERHHLACLCDVIDKHIELAARGN